ncbi:hypothetical protein NGA_0031802 [Nannochloropsis gaditana CCMP526]|uniref:uncharacterized protein n=1 Tax=Nannochloropsis gaditana (strain CCMP526) TaxID=1093141 RepID=UPI00029F6140|nr:hypothetical protein NGA_0031802 [Nannochloropsis gaditana CCMP526]EKU23329.1 hypothetical protein NGA_0031802 [Nannochloropsis gaditana CCMP526]|eukprot:XP_005852504.1 hypothetical protein NGA_0031802 [Nannochloropsis gaditana CCMP526]
MNARRKNMLEEEFRRISKQDQADLISLSSFFTSGEVAELLKEKLLAKAEVESFWIGELGDKAEPADLDAFLAVYEKIDALFEEEEEDEDVEVGQAGAVKGITLEEFLASGDVSRYLEENLISREEVESMWAAEAGFRGASAGVRAVLSAEGSMRVYAGIEDLLEEVVDDAEKSDETQTAVPEENEGKELRAEYMAAIGGDLEAEMDYAAFLRTNELPDLLEEGLVSREEVGSMWDKVRSERGTGDVVDFAGFQALSSALDDLFLEEGEEEEKVAPRQTAAAAYKAAAAAQAKEAEPEGLRIVGPAKPQLKEMLASVLLAGLLEEDKALDDYVGALVEAMLDEEANLAARDELEITDLQKAMEGEWELAYSTSRTMRYNRGLSGLGKSLPKVEFLGFSQSIAVNGFALETVYTERLRTLGRDLNVVVEGAWELKDVVSIMSGELCLIMDVLPATITYGFMRERIETGWKGVRVLNRCELLYLDEDLRVMKGQSSDSYFVFSRRTEGAADRMS